MDSLLGDEGALLGDGRFADVQIAGEGEVDKTGKVNLATVRKGEVEGPALILGGGQNFGSWTERNRKVGKEAASDVDRGTGGAGWRARG
jgi:hypothetical protein